MQAEPQSEHQWLQDLVGEWTFDGEVTMAPDKAADKFRGTESVRSLGGLWILAEGRGEMPGGGEMRSVMILGYDTQKKRYVGTFIASMMTHLWIYDGNLDAARRVLTLETEGPVCGAEGKIAKFRDVMERKSDAHRVLTSHMRDEDGTWRPFMTCTYSRKK